MILAVFLEDIITCTQLARATVAAKKLPSAIKRQGQQQISTSCQQQPRQHLGVLQYLYMLRRQNGLWTTHAAPGSQPHSY